MKYIYYIIAMLLIISGLLGYLLIPVRTAEKKAALIINGKTVSTDEFNKLFSAQSGHPPNRETFINSLITRELLIQESQKEGIDKEEIFRRSIQNFYEQSLIKLLMDRKFSSLCAETTDEELDRYIYFLKRKVRLTIFSFKTLEEAKGNRPATGETKTLSLEDLSHELQQPVAALKAGGVTEPIKTGEGYVVARLERIESPSSLAPAPDRDGLRKMLCEEKKEKMINDWIADLRKKATVKILIKE